MLKNFSEEDSSRNTNYFRDNLWVDRISLNWLHEQRFETSYEEATEEHQKHKSIADIEWRVHILLSLAEAAAKNNPGSMFVDLGVDFGIFPKAIKAYFSGCPVDLHYMYDSFKGLSLKKGHCTRDELRESDPYYAELGSTRFEHLRDYFGEDSKYKIIKGWLPDSLKEIPPPKPISLLNIDLNSAWPEISSLIALWPKIVRGGFILLDDYGRNPTQRKSHDQLCMKLNKTQVCTLPTGQGLIIKSNDFIT